uniref:Serine/threonine-protein kinase Nek10 n=1 Tax=Sphaerodactylus townsendi TaxID=933632 RepID=A0ACB8FU68_9SAUR
MLGGKNQDSDLRNIYIPVSLNEASVLLKGNRKQGKDSIGISGTKPRPALLPFDLLLKAPSLMFRGNVKKIEDSLVTGWKSHSLPAVILRNLKDHGST